MTTAGSEQREQLSREESLATVNRQQEIFARPEAKSPLSKRRWINYGGRDRPLEILRNRHLSMRNPIAIRSERGERRNVEATLGRRDRWWVIPIKSSRLQSPNVRPVKPI